MSNKITLEDSHYFVRKGFSGNAYVQSSDAKGYNSLLINVNGKHPKKRILSGNTRVYFVISGSGTFIINGENSVASPNDLYIIDADSVYQYSGHMSLFEFNISPDNSFGDKIE